MLSWDFHFCVIAVKCVFRVGSPPVAWSLAIYVSFALLVQCENWKLEGVVSISFVWAVPFLRNNYKHWQIYCTWSRFNMNKIFYMSVMVVNRLYWFYNGPAADSNWDQPRQKTIWLTGRDERVWFVKLARLLTVYYVKRKQLTCISAIIGKAGFYRFIAMISQTGY